MDSQGSGFGKGFLLGTLLGGVVGGVVGVVLASRLTAEPATDGAALKKPRRGRPSLEESMEATRQNLEEKIAELNETIDQVRDRLSHTSPGMANGGRAEVPQETEVN